MQSEVRGISGTILALLLTLCTGHGQASAPSEYALKAAFLYHFAQFVEWPTNKFQDARSPIVIGVLGENPFGGELEKTLAGKSINNRPITVKEVQSAAEATNTCYLLFISASEKKRFPEILAVLHGASVMTVGDTEGFTDAGGIINFFREGAKIRFEINDAAAKSAGLKISPKLLGLASRRVR